MLKQFETNRFDLVKADKVRIANYRFGHNRQGERDVWIKTSDKGERFLSQVIAEGEDYAVRKEIIQPSATYCARRRRAVTGFSIRTTAVSGCTRNIFQERRHFSATSRQSSTTGWLMHSRTVHPDKQGW